MTQFKILIHTIPSENDLTEKEEEENNGEKEEGGGGKSERCEIRERIADKTPEALL